MPVQMNYYYQSIASEEMGDYEGFYRERADQFSNDPLNIVELGIADGRSIIFMASYMKYIGKQCKIYGVDNFDYGKDYQRNTVSTNIQRSREENIIIMDSGSLDAAARFEDDFLNMVFIDSSHLYEHTKAEIRLWIRKIKLGGWLAGHDYNFPKENDPEPMNGVIQAVNEVIPADRLVKYDTPFHLGVWAVRKENGLIIK